jgi:hypothetical protein
VRELADADARVGAEAANLGPLGGIEPSARPIGLEDADHYAKGAKLDLGATPIDLAPNENEGEGNGEKHRDRGEREDGASRTFPSRHRLVLPTRAITAPSAARATFVAPAPARLIVVIAPTTPHHRPRAATTESTEGGNIKLLPVRRELGEHEDSFRGLELLRGLIVLAGGRARGRESLGLNGCPFLQAVLIGKLVKGPRGENPIPVFRRDNGYGIAKREGSLDGDGLARESRFLSAQVSLSARRPAGAGLCAERATAPKRARAIVIISVFFMYCSLSS